MTGNIASYMFNMELGFFWWLPTIQTAKNYPHSKKITHK